MKKIQYPNGQIGSASDKVADILAKRPGHKIYIEKNAAETKAEEKAKAKAEAEAKEKADAEAKAKAEGAK